MSIQINDNSIIFLNHRITIDDMINEIYYICNISHCNNPNIADSIYFSKLNNDDKNKLNNFREHKLFTAATIANKTKPIFNNNIRYQSYNNKICCISVKSILNDYYNNINCINDFMIYINIFYKVLKFKIKQERITKHIYNDLRLTNKKLNDIEHKYYDLKQLLRSQEKHINKLCNCIDYIYNSYDIINTNNTNNTNNINDKIKLIQNRQNNIIKFIIILTIINIINICFK
jgi:hypothetical protein